MLAASGRSLPPSRAVLEELQQGGGLYGNPSPAKAPLPKAGQPVGQIKPLASVANDAASIPAPVLSEELKLLKRMYGGCNK
jgi:hypothetical protein